MNEVDSAVARHLRDESRNQIHELIAPDSFPLETAHALTKAGRRGIVTDATRLWIELMVDSPQLFPSAADASRFGYRQPCQDRCLRLRLRRIGRTRRLRA